MLYKSLALMSVNFYETIKKGKPLANPNKHIHGIEMPFRMLIASGSGSGKTHALCRLIHAMGKTFHQIIVCVQTSDEPLYNMIDERLNTDKHKGVIFYENGEVPNINDYGVLQPNGRFKRIDNLSRLIVFDDLMMDKKANQIIANYFLRGRKCGFSSIYISQAFYQVPKVVRLNTQYFMLGKNIQKRDIRNILGIFSIDISLDQFAEIYNVLTDKPLDTILIDVINKTLRHNITGERYMFNNTKNCVISYNTLCHNFVDSDISTEVESNVEHGLPSDHQ